MKLLGIDFECQDDQAETTNITEVGCILVEVPNPSVKDFKEVARFEKYVWDLHYPPQREDIVALTGITDATLKKEGKSPAWVLGNLQAFIGQADYVVAHNKKFDETVYLSQCKKHGERPVQKPWLCTMSEIPFADKYTCKKLSHLAYDHGILVHPAKLHRAIQDVELMLALLAEYKIDEVLAFANEPWVYLQAVFPPPWEDHGVGKAKAQRLGFGWEKARGDDRVFTKMWVKRVKQSGVDNFKSKAHALSLTIKTL